MEGRGSSSSAGRPRSPGRVHCSAPARTWFHSVIVIFAALVSGLCFRFKSNFSVPSRLRGPAPSQLNPFCWFRWLERKLLVRVSAGGGDAFPARGPGGAGCSFQVSAPGAGCAGAARKGGARRGAALGGRDARRAAERGRCASLHARGRGCGARPAPPCLSGRCALGQEGQASGIVDQYG